MKPEEITELGWYIETNPGGRNGCTLITDIGNEKIKMKDLTSTDDLCQEALYTINSSLENYTYEYICPPSTLEEFKDNYPEFFL